MRPGINNPELTTYIPMKNTPLNVIVALAMSAGYLVATPPTPPEGFRWILQPEYSDEFDGTVLNGDKWHNYYPGWEGRAPAKFVPEALSVKDGLLRIQSGVLESPDRDYNIYGGAVVTKKSEAYYGYYECRAKASRINMSTTFWMSNDKVPYLRTEAVSDDAYSQELDIQECIGGSQDHPDFRKQMHSNTHYRFIHSGATKETFYSKGASGNLSSEVWEDFHTYGAWWKDAENVAFYGDDRMFATVKVTKEISPVPFDRGMHLNMVTETYNWQTPPTMEDLKDDDRNTALYDWVRSYRLVPVFEELETVTNNPAVFEERLNWISFPDQLSDLNETQVVFSYGLNQDALLHIDVIEGKNNVIQHQEKPLYAGLGSLRVPVAVAYPSDKLHYKIRISLMRAEESGEELSEIDSIYCDVSR